MTDTKYCPKTLEAVFKILKHKAQEEAFKPCYFHPGIKDCRLGIGNKCRECPNIEMVLRYKLLYCPLKEEGKND